MADLIEKFFKEDLSEAEKTALDQELASSPGSAERFGKLAEQAYNRFGLPEPKWTGPDKLNRISKSNFNSWLWPFALIFTLFGIYCWFYFQKADSLVENTDRSVDSEVKTPKLEMPIISKSKSNKVPVREVQPQQPITVAQAPPLPPVTPKFTPVNMDQNPSHPFSALAVQLRLASARSLTVRVLDSNSNELVPLFTGSLTAGNWVFEWNGKLRDGQWAPPGIYMIEVRAGSWVQSKKVMIQK